MRKTFSILTVAVLLLVATSAVIAQSGLPGSGWTSGQQIQNTSSTDSATIVLTAYDATGADFTCGSHLVAAGASYTFLTQSDCAVSSGFIGSAVASADQPIAAIVNVNNKPVGAAAGQYRGTDGGDVATSIVFPLVKNDHKGRTSTFYVQNASSSPNTITAVFNVNGVTYQKVYSNVPANAMVVVNPGDTDTPGPVPSGNGNVGGLTVTGTQPLAGSMLEHETSVAVAQNLQASQAFTPSEFDNVAFCPLVRNSHTGKAQTTGVQVMNVSGGAESVTIEYAVGSTTYGPFTSSTLQDGESYTFLTSGAQGIPAGMVGSATVSSVGGGDIAVIVNDKGINTSNPQRVTAYSCFPAKNATNTVSLPLVKEHAGINNTGVQVQNVSGDGSAATITATFKSTTGVTVVYRSATPVADGASMTILNVATPSGLVVVSGTPANLFGTVNGVVLTSDKPIVAIVNESSTTGSIQDTKNYEGFNQ